MLQHILFMFKVKKNMTFRSFYKISSPMSYQYSRVYPKSNLGTFELILSKKYLED